ncbi:hypothetical protein [Mesorhizobium sp.]|uniref:hypothetical protein n=1 Tax=Mesorhizobium sp. TaxID=1871066 RepID=UPI00257EBACA|nr:hypothetical protein [Mesorhizobium sp.]
MNRIADRLLAMLLLAIGMLCFTRVYFALGGVGEGFASARLAFFAATGVVSALAALLFWAGLLPGRSTLAPKTPLFGRGAELQPGGRPRLRRLFAVVPFLAVLALVADQLGPWSRQPQDAGKSLIAEQTVPSAPEGKTSPAHRPRNRKRYSRQLLPRHPRSRLAHLSHRRSLLQSRLRHRRPSRRCRRLRRRSRRSPTATASPSSGWRWRPTVTRS